jgi:hypothetical protein
MKNSPDSKIVEKLSQKTFWYSRKKRLWIGLAQNMVGILFPYHGEHCAGKKYILCE